MRLTAGFAKGMPLKSPKSPAHGPPPTRPTSDKVRAAVLNSLAGSIVEARILDLFAGTGAVGLEGLSRGAASCLFVEKNRAVAKVLGENIATLKQRAKASAIEVVVELRMADAAKVLPSFNKCFDIIFVDPPYDDLIPFLGQWGKRLRDLLQDGGTLVVESRKQDMEEVASILGEGWTGCRQKSYGDTAISYFDFD